MYAFLWEMSYLPERISAEHRQFARYISCPFDVTAFRSGAKMSASLSD